MSTAIVSAQETGFPDTLKGHGGPVKSVTVSDDGQRALTASFDYSIILWRLSGKEGEIIHRLSGHNAAVNDVAFVPGTELAVSVSDDGAFGIWDLATGTMRAMLPDTGDKVLDVAVSPDGRFAAAARWDGTARIYDIGEGRETDRAEGHRGNVNAVSFSLDGRALFTASYDGTIRSHAVAGDGTLDDGTVLHSHGWGINVITPLPGGSQLAFGSLNGTVGVVDLQSLEAVTLVEGEAPVLSIAVSPRAGLFATGSGDGHIRLFDTDTGALADDYQESFGPVWGMSFVPDGTALYRAGLDDFAIYWHFKPRAAFEPVRSVFPRRFSRNDVEDPGELEFLRKCSVCHTLSPDDANRAGPTLYGVFGRIAGTVEGYDYSKALIESEIVWTAETIGRLFDDGPDVVTPGTKMPVQRLKSVERRDALITYLMRATAPDGKTPPPGEVRQTN